MRFNSYRWRPKTRTGRFFYAVAFVIAGAFIVIALGERIQSRFSPPKMTIDTLMKFGGIGMDLDDATGMPHGVTRVHADAENPEDFAGLHCVDLSRVKSLAVSTSAVPQMNRVPRKFPVGTVIYKVGPSDYNKRYVVIAMRKREAGYDTKHNDWSYLYGESAKPYEAGRIDKCIACHSKVAGDDFVFNLMKPEQP